MQGATVTGNTACPVCFTRVKIDIFKNKSRKTLGLYVHLRSFGRWSVFARMREAETFLDFMMKSTIQITIF